MSPGFKFNEWEMKGVPIRLEVGMRDIQEKQLTCVRRDTLEKSFIKIDGSFSIVQEMLSDIQCNMLKESSKFLNSNIHNVNSFDEFKEIINSGGFVRCGWNGKKATEKEIKNETNATIRCIPFDQKKSKNLSCIYSNEEAKFEVIFAKAY